MHISLNLHINCCIFN